MTLTPRVKTYIEQHIDDIENGNFNNSIIYCPLDILADYVDTLREAEVYLPQYLVPFVNIATYLASIIKDIRLYQISIRSLEEETYTFEFPYQNLDTKEVNYMISTLCSHCYTSCDYDLDYSNQRMQLTVSTHAARLYPSKHFKF